MCLWGLVSPPSAFSCAEQACQRHRHPNRNWNFRAGCMRGLRIQTPLAIPSYIVELRRQASIQDTVGVIASRLSITKDRAIPEIAQSSLLKVPATVADRANSAALIASDRARMLTGRWSTRRSGRRSTKWRCRSQQSSKTAPERFFVKDSRGLSDSGNCRKPTYELGKSSMNSIVNDGV